jgi:hypothetical protein
MLGILIAFFVGAVFGVIVTAMLVANKVKELESQLYNCQIKKMRLSKEIQRRAFLKTKEA